MSGNASHQFKNTHPAAVTAAAAVAFPPTPLTAPFTFTTPVTIRFVADVAVHLKWAAKGDAPSAAVTDGLVPANCIEYITVGPNEQVEIIGASGVTTGNSWFTVVSG